MPTTTWRFADGAHHQWYGYEGPLTLFALSYYEFTFEVMCVCVGGLLPLLPMDAWIRSALCYM